MELFLFLMSFMKVLLFSESDNSEQIKSFIFFWRLCLSFKNKTDFSRTSTIIETAVLAPGDAPNKADNDPSDEFTISVPNFKEPPPSVLSLIHI